MSDKLPRSVRELSTVLESQPDLLRAAEALLTENVESRAWGEGPAVLRDTERFIERFVILPPYALLPVALWIIGTHLFDAFETFPYLALLSPEKGCGKTRTTEVIEHLVANPVRAVSVSEAALFRLIDSEAPTVILDEAESVTGKGERAEAVRALLNAGNRSGVKVPRCVGNSHELRMFNVYCPKIVCAIRVCPETVRDRAIVIPMQRKRPSERVERFILRRVRPEGETLRQRIAALAGSNRAAIVTAYERMDADFLSDRDLENIEPLLAILTVADPARLAELRHAAERLTDRKASDSQNESLALRLISDIIDVWPESERTIFTSELLGRLREVSDSPWAGERPDFALSGSKLARMLRPYEIYPAGTVRVGEKTAKGYRRDEVETAFCRYLSMETSHPSQTA
jgi:Protein of unknown function (DUF3631)